MSYQINWFLKQLFAATNDALNATARTNRKAGIIVASFLSLTIFHIPPGRIIPQNKKNNKITVTTKNETSSTDH